MSSGRILEKLNVIKNLCSGFIHCSNEVKLNALTLGTSYMNTLYF